ncbi:MAG: universal stress protein [Luteolibacter sp.]
MYQHILIPLENDWADATILAHVRKLAQLTGARLMLVHVADGWAARNFSNLALQESEEMREDRAYLERRVEELRADGYECEAVLLLGEPADEIIKLVNQHHIDLVAMATHGHQLVGDLIFGSTSRKVRHHVKIPVLLLMAERPPAE